VSCNYAYAPFLGRVDGAVIVTGADLGIGSFNLDVARGLGYRWDADSSDWVQIPIQIDERVTVDFGTQPGNNNSAGVAGTIYGSDNLIGITVNVYADPNTWVGADSDATFDDDDELVFLSRDAGPQAPNGQAPPAAATGGIGLELAIVDPDGGTLGYVYLFYGAAGVDSSAGIDHVTYNFSLDAGNYKDDYLRANGPNPESSTVATDNYSMAFSDRWITDEFSSNWGTGVDMLDGHKAHFWFSTCARSNATFACAEGAFIANIDGQIRAIRSYIGANSSLKTQRTEIFFEDRYEQVTDLRVHSIAGVMSFWDWSAAAAGATYGSSTLASPVTIDGSPDTVSTAIPSWECIEGAQGDITLAAGYSGTYVPTLEQVCVDDTTPPFSECWGDGDFYGAAGQAIVSGIPNTDPALGSFLTFQGNHVAAVWPTNMDMNAWAPVWAAQALQPMDVTITNY
jgi:hypothetical protein